MKIYTFLSVVCIVLCFYFMPEAQQESSHIPEIGMADFEIQISTCEDGYEMTCLKGCHWKELSYGSWFSLFGMKSYGSSIVDDNGVGDYNTGLFNIAKPNVQNRNADFAFIVQRTATGFELEGVRGTAWESLNFECIDHNCVAVIDANGLVSQN